MVLNFMSICVNGFGMLNKIALVDAHDGGGGAAAVARAQVAFCNSRGIATTLFVGEKRTADNHVEELPKPFSEKTAKKFFEFMRKNNLERLPKYWTVTKFLRKIVSKENFLADLVGHEKVNFTSTQRLLSLHEQQYQLIHMHNLHGDYFDLRLLPDISKRLPTFVTMHDAWLLAGHCAHSFDCDRWKTGCGSCPYLTTYPAIRRDGSAFNWQRKAAIYKASFLYLISPSNWLAERIKKSMLMPAVQELRVIPNGVDTDIFFPRNKLDCRAELGLDRDKYIILFAAQGLKTNVFKDFTTTQLALELLGARRELEVLCLFIGDSGDAYDCGGIEVRFTGYITSQTLLAKYYGAADLYIHPAKAETYGLTIVEAMASGLPVIASRVGGIPELVVDIGEQTLPPTGILIPVSDAEALAQSILQLIGNSRLRQQLGENAVLRVRERFTLKAQFQAYLSFYEEVLSKKGSDDFSSSRLL